MIQSNDQILMLSNTNNINDLLKSYMFCDTVFEKNLDTIDFDLISKYQKLSEKFIIKHQDKLNFEYITKYQQLSENTIELLSDKIHWQYVGWYNTNLSEEFIIKHLDKLNWENIKKQKTYLKILKINIKITYWKTII